MADYRRLKVWEQAHQAVLDLYATTARFPVTERYGLTAQLRRSAISVPSNIAEGTGRRADGDFRRFLAIALGSNLEFEYQLLVSRDLGYITTPDHDRLSEQVSRVSRMLNALITRLDKALREAATNRKRAAMGRPAA